MWIHRKGRRYSACIEGLAWIVTPKSKTSFTSGTDRQVLNSYLRLSLMVEQAVAHIDPDEQGSVTVTAWGKGPFVCVILILSMSFSTHSVQLFTVASFILTLPCTQVGKPANKRSRWKNGHRRKCLQKCIIQHSLV